MAAHPAISAGNSSWVDLAGDQLLERRVKDGKILAVMSGFDGSVEPDTWIRDTLGLFKQAAAKQ